MEYRLAERRRMRKNQKIQPSHWHRSKAKPKRKPGERYDTRSLYHAVAYGMLDANAVAERKAREAGAEIPGPIPSWHPN